MASTKIPLELTAYAPDADGATLELQTTDTTVTDGSVLGKIEFKAPKEASGTDAILVGAAIEAVAEGTFAADNNATELVFKTGASEAAASKMVLTSAGNLSIASGAIAVGQSTFSGGSVIADFHTSGSGVGTQLTFANDHNTDKFYVGLEGNTTGDAFLYQQKDADINFYTNNTFRAKLDNSGHLSVGATSITNGGGYNKVIQVSGTEGCFSAISGSNEGLFAQNGVNTQIVNRANGYMEFRTNNTERMRINSSGNVGIGTSNPGHPLHIAESADGTKIRLNRAGVSEWDFSIGNSSTLSGVGSGALEILPQNGGTANEFAIGQAGTTTALFHLTTSGATFSGSISKGSGSFKIDHPLPSKTDTHHLVHSFVEAPQADNIYRGSVDLVDGVATVNIDTEAGMTDGTFVLLNTNVQCFTSNESGWTAIKGSVSGNTLTITAQNNSCTDTISWMVVGERHDDHMKDTNWTDSNGKVIVEPKKT